MLVAAEPLTPWHFVQSVPLTMLLEDVHAGVVWPPWQLTLLQVSAAGVKAAVAPFALNLPSIATGAGPLAIPVRPFAFW